MGIQNLSSEEISRQVKKDYNLIAKSWHQTRRFPSALKVKMVSRIKEGERVLDLGCGNGMMLPFVLERGGHYTGVDFSEELLAIASEKYAQKTAYGCAQFLVGEVTDLPFAENEFDMVISFAVLHHLPTVSQREKFFSEIYRVLKPGGETTVIVWNLLNDWTAERFGISPKELEKNCHDCWVPWRAGDCVIQRYVHQFSPLELQTLVATQPFKNFKLNFYNQQGALTLNGAELVLQMEK